MNTLFNNDDEIKIRICDRNIHKAMQITVGFYQRNKKLFVTIQPECMATIYLSNSVRHCSFAIINFQIYKIIVTKWKHVTSLNYIISFNEEL